MIQLYSATEMLSVQAIRCERARTLSTRDQHTKIPIYINLLHDFYAGTVVCALNMELLRIKLHTHIDTFI